MRSVASSRVRWAIVIESVFTITNAPTKRATNPNASRNFCRNERKDVVSLASCLASCSPVRTCAVGGRTERISSSSFGVVCVAVFDTRISSSWPSFWNSRCAVGRSKIAIVAPPIVETPPSSAMPTMWNGLVGPCTDTPICWPTS